MADNEELPSDSSNTTKLHVLIDTNVMLDLVLAREPWATQAKPMWDARDGGNLVTYLPASVLTDIFYIYRKQVGAARAKSAVEESLRRCIIIPIDRTILESALTQPGGDFEDNIQIVCARSLGLDLIATRDPAGFAQAPIAAIEPSAIVGRLPMP
ncbi:MAG TPA: PIN domain-containing protein [Ktedonobacterales bacterium]